MTKSCTRVVLLVMAFVLAGALLARNDAPKSGPLTGTWECQSHGGPHGDMQFTLTLEQIKEDLTGSVASPMGSTEISSGTLKKNLVEIHIDTPDGNYVLTAKLKKDQLVDGQWSMDSGDKGTWEGKKSSDSSR